MLYIYIYIYIYIVAEEYVPAVMEVWGVPVLRAACGLRGVDRLL